MLAADDPDAVLLHPLYFAPLSVPLICETTEAGEEVEEDTDQNESELGHQQLVSEEVDVHDALESFHDQLVAASEEKNPLNALAVFLEFPEHETEESKLEYINQCIHELLCAN